MIWIRSDWFEPCLEIRTPGETMTICEEKSLWIVICLLVNVYYNNQACLLVSSGPTPMHKKDTDSPRSFPRASTIYHIDVHSNLHQQHIQTLFVSHNQPRNVSTPFGPTLSVSTALATIVCHTLQTYVVIQKLDLPGTSNTVNLKVTHNFLPSLLRTGYQDSPQERAKLRITRYPSPK